MAHLRLGGACQQCSPRMLHACPWTYAGGLTRLISMLGNASLMGSYYWMQNILLRTFFVAGFHLLTSMLHGGHEQRMDVGEALGSTGASQVSAWGCLLCLAPPATRTPTCQIRTEIVHHACQAQCAGPTSGMGGRLPTEQPTCPSCFCSWLCVHCEHGIHLDLPANRPGWPCLPGLQLCSVPLPAGVRTAQLLAAS